MLSLEVDNIKCGGCAHQITKKLKTYPGIEDVSVDVDKGIVSVTGLLDQDLLGAELQKMGYPPAGTSTLGTTATSFVSCMIGRIDKASS